MTISISSKFIGLNNKSVFSKNFKEFLTSQDLIKGGQPYSCVAVIGCQSSGKSTLLNGLFGTKFQTMDNQMGRQQTTKGIWMAHTKDAHNLNLVFDIEGTDSKERGDQRTTFEQTTSMLALALADVLIINMWTNDIGRYGASNYGLLEVIFECNLKLFGQQSAKKLMFVLRDFDDRGNNFERIMQTIKTDISNIWAKLYKPKACKDKAVEDFFDFEYSMLLHKVYQKDQFNQKVADLKKRFDTQAENSIFPKKNASRITCIFT